MYLDYLLKLKSYSLKFGSMSVDMSVDMCAHVISLELGVHCTFVYVCYFALITDIYMYIYILFE